MSILITGVTGHSGKWFLDELKKNSFSDEIHIIVRNKHNINIENSKLNIILHEGDLNDSTFLNECTKNIDTIVHIANIHYSLELIKSAVKNNVNWFIAVHTTGIFSKFKSASFEYKEIEKKIFKFKDKINITILRPTMIYGSQKDYNMHKLIKFIDYSFIFPLFGDGSNLMQPVHARDLGKAYYMVLDNFEKTSNKNYNLPGKNSIEYKYMINLVASKLNKKILILPIPISVAYNLTKICEKLPFFPISSEQVLRMKEDKAFSFEKAYNDFDYKPVSFEEGISDQINNYLSRKERIDLKRRFDLYCSIIGIFILFPLFTVTSIAIKLDSEGPILYKQKRPGINNEVFDILKFRSMVINTPEVETSKFNKGTSYITRVGKFIRRTSIDELPQLVNVIKGDMSIVGPRPALHNQIELINNRTIKGIHKVKPGITGFAQVMGRDEISDQQKLLYDEYYVKNKSFKFDIWIIYKTIRNVISSKGISH